MNYPGRRRKVLSEARLQGADGVLVTHQADIRYLTGFTGSSGAVAFSGGRAALFTDGRYSTQAKEEVTGTRVAIVKGPPASAACAWLESVGTSRCGFQAEHVSVTQFGALRSIVSASARRRFFLPIAGLIARVRERKDPDELDTMHRAADLGCELFDKLLTTLRSGMSEAEVALTLEVTARRSGADGMSFETIVAGGQRSALPHGRASQARLPRRGFVTLDFGVIVEGYCSDMTRTVHLSRAREDEKDVYDAVLEAQMAAIAAAAPGVPAQAVDEAARKVLRKLDLERYFVHSTGHGVGLEIHEGPRLAAKQQQELRPGMVITIEPGVYLPGRFGVRIEDMVVITKTGNEVMTRSPKAYLEL